LPQDGLFLGKGWYALDTFGKFKFHWANNDAEIVVTAPTGKRNQFRMTVEAGPSLADQPFELQILDRAGRVVVRTNVNGRQTISLSLPIVAGRPEIYRLHVDGGGRPIPKDPRILNFRIFEFGWDND